MRKRKYYIPGKLKNDDVDNENLSVGCNSLKFELCVFPENFVLQNWNFGCNDLL